MMPNCPCGTDKAYLDCCGIYLSGKMPAPTPEALMRSRYTAYYQNNIEYIAKTMKSPAADNFDSAAMIEQGEKIKWIKLEVIATENDVVTGTVEFRAHYLLNNIKHTLHEISDFIFQDGAWYYVDGKWGST